LDETFSTKMLMEENLSAILCLSHAGDARYLEAKRCLLRALVYGPHRVFALNALKEEFRNMSRSSGVPQHVENALKEEFRNHAHVEIERIEQGFLRRRTL
jgi:hypothetical protein